MEWVIAGVMMIITASISPTYLCFVDGANGQGCFAPTTSSEYVFLSKPCVELPRVSIARLLL